MKWNLPFGCLCLFCLVAFAAMSPARAEKPTDASVLRTAANNADDERQLRQSADKFTKAYNARDAKAVAALFTSSGEVIGEEGTVTQGTEAIEQLFADEFAAGPADQVAIEIDSLRFLNADTADEEGRLLVTDAENQRTVSTRYCVLHVREGNSWLVASARNFARDEAVSAHDHLGQLEWMIGDWIDEGPDSLVTASCRWDESGNFLLRDYSIQRAGHVVMSGTHRIGWDALGKQLKSWTFDSEGGHAAGYWHHNGDRWILKLSGVSSDGQLGTATHIYTHVSPHLAKWQAVERTLGGESLDDLDEITIVRAPTSPESRATVQNKDTQ